MCMAWKSRPRGDGSSGGGASIFWTETVRTAPLKRVASVPRRRISARAVERARIDDARGNDVVRARGRGVRRRRVLLLVLLRRRVRARRSQILPRRRQRVVHGREGGVRAGGVARAPAHPLLHPATRGARLRLQDRGGGPRRWCVSRRRRRSPRRATGGPEAFTRHPRRFPPLRRAKGRARAAPRRLPARSSRPSPRVRIIPLSHSADRLTPSPLSSPRAAAPPPPRRVENTGVYDSAGTSPSPSIPAMGFALDPTFRASLDDSFRSGERRRHPRPVPRPKRGSTPSREANAMWERNLADGSASDANSSVDGSARDGGGDSAFGWSPRSSPLASPSQSRGGSTHAGAEIPRAGILKRRAMSLDVVSRAADEWNAATPSPSPSPSPPRSPDESSPRSSSSSSIDEHEHEHEHERERERARTSDRRVRFGSETSVAEVLIDAPPNVRSNVPSNAYPTSNACASRTSPRRASTDGTASLVMGSLGFRERNRERKRSGMDANANSWRVGSTLHARVSMDGARAEDRPRRRLRFSAA